jgi:hypothetical protein
MRRTPTVIAISILAGAVLAGSLAAPASAAKSGLRYYQQARGAVIAPPYRYFRCHGRYYNYGRGWGCDYYFYSYDWPKGRRR